MEKKSIKEIEAHLLTISDINDPFIKKMEQDKRKGIQILLKRWVKAKEKELQQHELFESMRVYEQDLFQKGFQYIAGVDEVGRGPLAGPVVAAAVILPQTFYLPGINDSKKLSEAMREEYFKVIKKEALAVGIGIISAEIIDKVNIYEATKLAMLKAITELEMKPDHLLVDAMTLPINIPQTSIVKGDSSSISIAASSIIAKVTRDRLMKKWSDTYPQYGFEKHMGYGTNYHLEAIKKYGVVEIHRKTFAPVKEALN